MIIRQLENTNGPWDIYRAKFRDRNGNLVSDLFDCGLDGIDLRFLEYSLGYLNMSSDESPQSLVNLIPLSEMDNILGISSELSESEKADMRRKNYRFLTNIIVPTQYKETIDNFSGNGINCFGSYSFGTQITYVIPVQGRQGVTKIELFNIEDREIFEITFGGEGELTTEDTLLEIQCEKVVFISINQADGDSYSNQVSYHAWTKLINPVRKFNEGTLLDKDLIDPPQFLKDDITGFWFDEASGSILGDSTEVSNDLPILKKKKDKLVPSSDGLLKYSPWKEYSINEKVIWKGETYRSLKNHNLGHTPGISKWWIREVELTNYYTRQLIPILKSEYLIGDPKDTGSVSPSFYNIMPWTKKVRFEVRPNYDKGYRIILNPSNVQYELRRPYEDSDLYYVDLDLSNFPFTDDSENLYIWVEERFRDRKFMSPEVDENLNILGYKKLNDLEPLESSKRCGSYRILDVIGDDVKISIPLISGSTRKIDNLAELLKGRYNIRYVSGPINFNGTSDEEFYGDVPSGYDSSPVFTDYVITCEEVGGGYNYNMEFYIPYSSGTLVSQEYVSGLYFGEIKEFFVAISNSGDIMINNPYQVVELNGSAEIKFKLYNGIPNLVPEVQSDDNIVSIPISTYVWVVNKPDGTRNVDSNGNRIMADPQGAEQNISLKYNKTEREYTLKIENIEQNYTIDIVL